MKKNRLFMLGLVTVFVAVLSLTLVSSTFARYTSTVTGGDSARVAKWEWEFTGDVVGTDHTETLTTVDLFKVAVFELTENGTGNVDVDSDDAEVANGTDGTPIIAPGTGGVATFNIINTSEVTATYTVNYTADNKGVRLEWSKDNATWTSDITTITESGELAHTNGTTAIKLYWRWTIGDNSQNAGDTTHGQNGEGVRPTVGLTIVMTQKD